ncbi:MAG: hypothetical protein U0Y68_06750 [Blastocatellia bacterium]
MIRFPDIIPALLDNHASTPEAVRRATGCAMSFEKELGVKRIEEERRVLLLRLRP